MIALSIFFRSGKMSALAIAKVGVQIVAGLGVTRVVTQVIQNNTTIVTTVDKILVNTGAFVLGSIVVDHASDRVTYAMDKFIDWSEKRKEEIEEVVEEEGKNGNKSSKDSD
jgi:hypothetical protein